MLDSRASHSEHSAEDMCVPSSACPRTKLGRPAMLTLSCSMLVICNRSAFLGGMTAVVEVVDLAHSDAMQLVSHELLVGLVGKCGRTLPTHAEKCNMERLQTSDGILF